MHPINNVYHYLYFHVIVVQSKLILFIATSDLLKIVILKCDTFINLNYQDFYLHILKWHWYSFLKV